MIHSRQELSEYLEKRKAPAPHGSTGKYIPRRRKDFSTGRNRAVKGAGLVSSPCAAAGGVTLDGFSGLCFFALGGGEIYSLEPLPSSRRQGRQAAMTWGRGAPAKPALWGEAGATGAVRTSGQLGPKPHSAVGDGEARSAGFGDAPHQAVFRVLAAGQNLKNGQVWPHLPCLPVSEYALWPCLSYGFLRWNRLSAGSDLWYNEIDKSCLFNCFHRI